MPVFNAIKKREQVHWTARWWLVYKERKIRHHYGIGGVLGSLENYPVSHGKKNETTDCNGIVANKLEGNQQWYQESSKSDGSMQEVLFTMYLSGLEQQHNINCLLFDYSSSSYQWAILG